MREVVLKTTNNFPQIFGAPSQSPAPCAAGWPRQEIRTNLPKTQEPQGYAPGRLAWEALAVGQQALPQGVSHSEVGAPLLFVSLPQVLDAPAPCGGEPCLD